MFPSTKRKGLGRHRVKGDPDEHLCRGRKVSRRGQRQHPRHIKTCFGALVLPLNVVQCRRCGAQYSPLLAALGLDPYARREVNLEHEVMEAVIDTDFLRIHHFCATLWPEAQYSPGPTLAASCSYTIVARGAGPRAGGR